MSPRSFHAEIVNFRMPAVLRLAGTIDLVSMAAFEAALSTLLATRRTEVVIDALSVDFISVRGFALIGRSSLAVDRLTLRTRNVLAPRVLTLLGFDAVGLAEGPDLRIVRETMPITHDPMALVRAPRAGTPALWERPAAGRRHA